MKKTTLFLISIFATFLNANDDVLHIVYEQRAPYVENTKNSVKGLVATPAIKALEKAKINYILKEKPSKRHLYEIKSNTNMMCALGWFKTPEREKFAKFTLPLYQDDPLGIVSRKENHKKFENIDINQLLQDKSLSLLTKASYSYGIFLDEKIIQNKVDKREVYSDNSKMLTLIEAKRADYMFISKEEADLLFKKNKYKDLQFYKIKNMPKGSNRYLICSKLVSDNIIEKINKYLKENK